MLNEDMQGTVDHLAQASQTNPVVLYWSAEAYKALGDVEKARDLANRAANRNTLSAFLPFVRNEALELLADQLRRAASNVTAVEERRWQRARPCEAPPARPDAELLSKAAWEARMARWREYAPLDKGDALANLKAFLRCERGGGALPAHACAGGGGGEPTGSAAAAGAGQHGAQPGKQDGRALKSA